MEQMEHLQKWSPFGVGNKRERIIILVSAIIGIVAFILLLRRSNAKAAEAEAASLGYAGPIDYGSPSDMGGYSYGYISPSGGLTPEENLGVVPVSGVDYSLAYGQDTGIKVSGGIESSSQGRSFGIGGGGYSLNIGGGGSSSKRTASIEAANAFQGQVQIINASPDSIESVQNFLQRVGGTAEERMAEQKALLATTSSTVGHWIGAGMPKQKVLPPTNPSPSMQVQSQHLVLGTQSVRQPTPV